MKSISIESADTESAGMEDTSIEGIGIKFDCTCGIHFCNTYIKNTCTKSISIGITSIIGISNGT